MKRLRHIFLLFSLLLCYNTHSKADTLTLEFKFFGDSLHTQINDWRFVDFDRKISSYSIQEFYDSLNQTDYEPIIKTLVAFKEKNKLDDWLYYQLIRKTAQQISPKNENYNRYTLYKWFLLNKSGYNASLAIRDSELLFYAQSNDNIYDIPYYFKDGKQFVCLNLHDYGKIDFAQAEPNEVAVKIPEGKNPFTYRITSMPEFSDNDYAEKDIQFDYKNKAYLFKVKVNSQIQSIFANYPVVDYESYFNIPLSKETYNSLIPELKEQVKGMNQKNGVDYLMRFTRNAFSYENDQENFGKEKRLSPEQTLVNKYSDCDDRAALFFCLVKEIYNLPMIVLAYPTHVTIAVNFDKSVGKPIVYKNKQYFVCEPTPQAEDLSIGQLSSKLKDIPFQVAYEYDPQR